MSGKSKHKNRAGNQNIQTLSAVPKGMRSRTEMVGGKGMKSGIPGIVITVCAFVLSFLLYGNTASNGFGMDDELVTTTDLQRHPVVEEGISGIVRVFTSRYATDNKQSYSYRPITTLTFSIEWDLWGGRETTPENRARNSHIINILLYALCILVLYRFLRIASPASPQHLLLLITVVFAIHPIHSETVNNIKGRDEMLAFLFMFGAGIRLFKFYDFRKKSDIFLVLLLFMLALLSKPSAVTGVALLPLSLYFFRNVNLKQAGIFFGIMAMVLLSARVLRNALVDQPAVRNYQLFENPLYGSSITERIPAFFETNLWYGLKLLFPYPLRYYYGYDQVPVSHFNALWFAGGVLLVFGLLIIAWKGIKKKNLWAFGALFYLFAIGGAANLLIPMPGIVAERFAFIASVGFAVLIALTLQFLLKRNDDKVLIKTWTRPYLIVAALTVVSTVYSIQRNQVWSGKFMLYKTDLAGLQKSAKAHSLLAEQYYRKATIVQKSGDVSKFSLMQNYSDSAVLLLKRAVEISPDFSSSWNNLGSNYYSFYFDTPTALMCFRKATSSDSNNVEAAFNRLVACAELAEIYIKLSRFYLSPDSVKAGEDIIRESNRKMLNDGVLGSMQMLLQIERMGREMAGLKQGKQGAAIYFQFVRYFEELQKHKYINVSNFISSFEQATQSGQVQFPSDQAVYFTWSNTARELPKILELPSENIQKVLLGVAGMYQDTMRNIFKHIVQLRPEYPRLFIYMNGQCQKIQDMESLFMVAKYQLKTVPDKAGHSYVQLANIYVSKGMMDSALVHYAKADSALVALYNRQLRGVFVLPALRLKADNTANEVNKLRAHVQNLPNIIGQGN